MSEDKIMDIIKGKLLMIERMLKQDDEEGHTSAYEMQFEDFEAIQGLLDLYEKKSKMIDIMAENLTTPVHNKDWVIKYFEDEVELEKEEDYE